MHRRPLLEEDIEEDAAAAEAGGEEEVGVAGREGAIDEAAGMDREGAEVELGEDGRWEHGAEEAARFVGVREDALEEGVVRGGRPAGAAVRTTTRAGARGGGDVGGGSHVMDCRDPEGLSWKSTAGARAESSTRPCGSA